MLEMSVMENVYITHEPLKKSRFIDYKKMKEDTIEQLRKLKAEHIDPLKKAGDLALPEKQMVEIAKALAVDCKILIMDEPTTSLTWDEAERLFEIINTLKKQGITIIYISHRMDEIFKICNRAIVMRDGRLAGELLIKDSTQDDLVQMMSGRVVDVELADKKYVKSDKAAEPVLTLEHITDGGFIEDLSLSLYENEVLGIGGLVGSKRTELARMICGADPLVGGTVKIKGKTVKIRNAGEAIRQGIGYLSENRKEDGLSLGIAIEENTVHCDMKAVSNRGLVAWKKVRDISDQYIEKLKTKGKSATKVVNLSGGNQQKVAIAKWLHAGCNILIFDEPTRGIDVAAKAEIHQLIREFAGGKGRAAIVISSEVNELVAVSDRVIIMSKGHITGEMEGSEINQADVLKCITTKGR